MNLPIMTLHERVLSVLGCKYVDDVLIDAPYMISQVLSNSKKYSDHDISGYILLIVLFIDSRT
jgi:glycerol-3-phosphate cytidylyltransferase-like family protein